MTGIPSNEMETTSNDKNSAQHTVRFELDNLSPKPLNPRQMRRLSLPDMHKLRKAVALREDIGDTQIPLGKLQVDLLNMRSETFVKRPLMRLRVGAQHYYSHKSKKPTGDWNEGFLFVMSYHSQLFDTLEFDLYDKAGKWSKRQSKHVAKAKLKISKLEGKPDMFLTYVIGLFLPLYEYRKRRELPNNVKIPKHLRRIQVSKLSTGLAADAAPEQFMHRRVLIGNIFVRVRYVYQHPKEESADPTPVYMAFNRSESSYTGNESSKKEGNDVVQGGGPQPTDPDNITAYARRTSQHGRPDLALPDSVVQDQFTERLSVVMTNAPVPEKAMEDHSHQLSSESTASSSTDKANALATSPTSPSDTQPKPSKSWLWKSDSPSNAMLPAAINGLMYGFSQRDSDKSSKIIPKTKDSDTTTASSESDMASIQSAGFGDKVFASKWMNESFEEIAVSHPTFDKMIGMVVSPETRALVRGVLKLASAFGQGFKVTTFQLLTAMSILEKFYSERPVVPTSPIVDDIELIDEARHYFQHAIIAYGWRGLYYLGEYGKYLRDVQRSKSNREAIVKFLNIAPQDLLGYEYGLRKGAVFQPSYFVSVDKPRKAIILGIRGTWSLYDCITDLVCEYRPWKGGLAHSGMLASAQWFFTNIIPQIFHYVHNHHSVIDNFIITGHSLGAGSAGLLTMMVVDHIEELRYLSNNPNFRVHCYSYAPVAAVTEELGNAYADYIDSFVCQDDIVARTSYGTAMELKELIMDALAAVEAVGGIGEVNKHDDARKACFDAIETCRQQIYQKEEPEFPLLHIPGKIWQFKRSHPKVYKHFRPISAAATSSFSTASLIPPLPTGRHHTPHRPAASRSEPMLFSVLEPSDEHDFVYTLHNGSPKISEEMVVTRSCVEDHMMVTYMKALQQVWEHSAHKKRSGYEAPQTPTPVPKVESEISKRQRQKKNKVTSAISTKPDLEPYILPARSMTCPSDLQHTEFTQVDTSGRVDGSGDPQQGWFSRLFKSAR
ncbi:hypothetical protein INT43_009112 [Umbelopsis isabellina]|uniref:sn-1-specific diacylglycerol lipase n=1 Tax=Mortierella isabellina TaxID=91625 RepID=A0A8H7PDM7_MORIS|nr:hypothetical protein INT43_009112 [Umbelopsis isabellina]